MAEEAARDGGRGRSRRSARPGCAWRGTATVRRGRARAHAGSRSRSSAARRRPASRTSPSTSEMRARRRLARRLRHRRRQLAVHVRPRRARSRSGSASTSAPSASRSASASTESSPRRRWARRWTRSPPTSIGSTDGRRPTSLVGIGGAVTNLAAVKHGLATYDPDVVRGTVLDRAEIDRQIELYRTRTADERREIVGLQPKRAEVILAGACIVRTVLEKLGRDSLTVSDRRPAPRAARGALRPRVACPRRSCALELVASEIEERGLHAQADVLRLAEVELQEDRVDVALDRALRDPEARGDRAVAAALGDQGEDLELARRQPRQLRVVRAGVRRRACRRPGSPRVSGPRPRRAAPGSARSCRAAAP